MFCSHHLPFLLPDENHGSHGSSPSWSSPFSLFLPFTTPYSSLLLSSPPPPLRALANCLYHHPLARPSIRRRSISLLPPSFFLFSSPLKSEDQLIAYLGIPFFDQSPIFNLTSNQLIKKIKGFWTRSSTPSSWFEEFKEFVETWLVWGGVLEINFATRLLSEIPISVEINKHELGFREWGRLQNWVWLQLWNSSFFHDETEVRRWDKEKRKKSMVRWGLKNIFSSGISVELNSRGWS